MADHHVVWKNALKIPRCGSMNARFGYRERERDIERERERVAESS